MWFLILVALFLPLPSLAYIDPGGGSYIAQILIAFLLGAAYILKSFWRKIYYSLKKLPKTILAKIRSNNHS